MSALNGKEMEDKELYVGRAQKKSEREAALKQRYSMPSDCHACPLRMFVHMGQEVRLQC